jgi:hypothetical protein
VTGKGQQAIKRHLVICPGGNQFASHGA